MVNGETPELERHFEDLSRADNFVSPILHSLPLRRVSLASATLTEEVSFGLPSLDQTRKDSTAGVNPVSKLCRCLLHLLSLQVFAQRRVGQRATAQVVGEGDQGGELVLGEAAHEAVHAALKLVQIRLQQFGSLGLA